MAIMMSSYAPYDTAHGDGSFGVKKQNRRRSEPDDVFVANIFEWEKIIEIQFIETQVLRSGVFVIFLIFLSSCQGT